MKTVIITQNIHKPLETEPHANLSVACKFMGWSYEYVRKYKAKKFPFMYKDFWVSKKTINRN